MDKLEHKINELRAYPAEEEWFEFKDNWIMKPCFGQK